MPPSDDLQELIAESSSSSTSGATSTTAATGVTSSLTGLNTSLHDELSGVFEAKMTKTQLCEKENSNNAVGAVSSSTATTSSNSLGGVLQPVLVAPDRDDTGISASTTPDSESDATEKPSMAAAVSPHADTNTETVDDTPANTTGDNDDEKHPVAPADDEQDGTIAAETEATTGDTGAPDAPNNNEGPFSMIRKGAVAAVGGTMVGVGLVMIPLPTPFGAVIASSGLAVLGTEFKEAKDMNDRLIEGAKGTVKLARDRIVSRIESMEVDDFDADREGNSNPTNLNATTDDTSDDSQEKKEDAAPAVVKVGFLSEEKKVSGDSEDPEQEHEAPRWLHMNPVERERQERIAREKYRRENQTSYQQTKEYFAKKTGSFLSRNLLPLLKEKKQTDEPRSDQVTNPITSAAKEEEEGYVLIEQTDSADCTSGSATEMAAQKQ
mmetsp:Transcript_25002/g.40957  ORF Transcript_25002/g.40957 Transcript_25002/m.40957 type:complete len:437 (-) Transcript_25002:133-1443(-)